MAKNTKALEEFQIKDPRNRSIEQRIGERDFIFTNKEIEQIVLSKKRNDFSVIPDSEIRAKLEKIEIFYNNPLDFAVENNDLELFKKTFESESYRTNQGQALYSIKSILKTQAQKE